MGQGVGALFNGTLINSGVIDSSGSITVYFRPDPIPYNFSAGVVSGVLNANGSLIDNTADGTIHGAEQGVFLGAGVLRNFGNITGTQAVGIEVQSGPVTSAIVYNYGTLAGSLYGVKSLDTNPSNVYNYVSGLITGSVGILENDSKIHNAGTISASSTGIIMHGVGTIIDAGLIIGAGGTAIVFSPGLHNDLLELTPSATVIGAIDLNGTLELQAGFHIGTIDGSALRNVDAFLIDTKAEWAITGSFATNAKSAFQNDGILVDLGTLSLNSKLTGIGTVILGTAPLSLENAVASTEKLVFTSTAETLVLGDAAAMKATIEHFAAGDTIDLSTIPRGNITGEAFSKGILILSESTGQLTFTFASPASFSSEAFHLFRDGTGTGITLTGAAGLQSSPSAYQPERYSRSSAVQYVRVLGNGISGGWVENEFHKPIAMATPATTLS